MVIQQFATLFQLWWSSTSGGAFVYGGVLLHTASAFAQWWGFLFSYYCCCAHLSAVVERCLWHRLVHTATQLSKQGPDLLATGPGFDPH